MKEGSYTQANKSSSSISNLAFTESAILLANTRAILSGGTCPPLDYNFIKFAYSF